MGILMPETANRHRSQSKIAAQQVAVVLCTPRLRGSDLAKRGGTQGGRGGRGDKRTEPDMSIHPTPIYSQKSAFMPTFSFDVNISR